MRVFLTGATGYIGSAVLEAFVRNGHEVTAMVRDASRLRARGVGSVKALVADLGNGAAWTSAVAGHDVCIHTAFDGSARAVDIDRSTIDALLSGARKTAAGGTNTCVIYTSGVWILGSTTAPVDETAHVNPTDMVAFRPAHESAILTAQGANLRTAVIRPGVVVGGGRGIVGELFRDATNGLIRVVGPGHNRWPFVYVRDLADLYVRIATMPSASGVFHANDECDERVIDVVDGIAGHMTTRPDVRHVPLEEARAKQGGYADALALDQRVRSPKARAIGWETSVAGVAANVPRLYEEWRRAQSESAT